MVDSPSPSAAVAVNRRLTVNEVATIRAALRLWIETPGDFIPESCHDEAAGVGVLDDSAIERLVAELAGDAVAVTVTRFDPHDGRRI